MTELKADRRILARLDQLIADGKSVLATKTLPAPNHFTSAFVDVEKATQWMVSSISLLDSAFGPESAHVKRLTPLVTKYPKWPDAQQAMGVLLAAKDDLEQNALFTVRGLIEAELFDDFLEQAEHLHASGYYQPAAVVTGAVLEDGLRRLCEREGLSQLARPKLDSMNSALAKHGLYNKLTQKKVTALADIRNDAAHGIWDAFDSGDVANMIRDVRDFMAKNF